MGANVLTAATQLYGTGTPHANGVHYTTDISGNVTAIDCSFLWGVAGDDLLNDFIGKRRAANDAVFGMRSVG